MLKILLRLAMVVCVTASAAYAHAEGFALYEYSARGVALGGAMVARAPDASAVAHNPALMTRLPGINLMAGVTSVSPSGKMGWKDGSGSGATKMKDLTWYIPHVYYTDQLSDSVYLGVGEFTRYGLGFEYPKDWKGNLNVYEVGLTTFSISPNIAVKANDKLSFSMGMEFMYGTLDIKKRQELVKGVPASTADVRMTDMDDVGVGFNLGLHYQFNEQWAVGLTYRSQISAKLEGDAKIDLVANGARMYSGDVYTKVTLPDSVSFGVAWTPRPDFSLELGAVWTRWSTFDSLDFQMEGRPLAENPKDWKNVWRLNAGAEWQALDWLALRAGYVFDQSPMTSRYEDYLVPTDDRHIFSAGLGFKWSTWTVDFAYAYIHAIGREYDENKDLGVLDSKADASTTNVFSLSVGYRF